MQFKQIFLDNFGLETSKKFDLILNIAKQNGEISNIKTIFLSKFYGLFSRILTKEFPTTKKELNDVVDDFLELLLVLLQYKPNINNTCLDLFNIKPENFKDYVSIFYLLDNNIMTERYEDFANNMVYILDIFAIRSGYAN